jgi:DNA-binding transcriptional ArsR family regulator
VTADALASRAALLADRTRAAICVALLDGRAWTTTELARHASVAVSTASEHLTALVAGGMLTEVRQGRHRYLRLAGPHVAQLIEDMIGPPEPPVGLRQVRAAERLAAGRTCYDHLAGDIGVAIHQALAGRRLLSDAGLTDAGRSWFTELLGPDSLRRNGSRPLVRECLDWTRRLPHLGGVLGASLCSHMLDRGWVLRSDVDRAVTVTNTGANALHELLGIHAPAAMSS